MFKYNVTLSLIPNTLFELLVAAMGIVAVVMVYIVVGVVRDSQRLERRRVIENYRLAYLEMGARLITSERTGVLYEVKKQ